MRGELLPLFPLQTVLLPRAPLPLHIFEDRYKDLVRDVMLAHSEFGVVLAREEGVLNAGCTARIDRILRQFEDGRMDLMAIGERRFRILGIDSERSYLRAEVVELEDDEFEPTRERTRTEALQLHAQLVRAEDEEAETPGPDEPMLSFLLGAISPDVEFRQTLLGMRSEAQRIDLVAKHLARLIHRREVEKTMRSAARSNGHGKHWKG